MSLSPHNIFFHARGVVNFITVPLAIADEVGIQLRMFLAESLGFFQSHDHEGSSVCIGSGTILGDDCGREDAVLYGVSDTWVDGVCISFAILIIEFSIVS